MATRYRLTVKYDPNQPRHPAGVPEGGRFAPAGGGRTVFKKYRDNPGGEWEAQQQRIADERQAAADDPYTVAGRGLSGSTTLTGRGELPVSMLVGLEGVMGENPKPGSLKFDRLLASVEKNGFQDTDPVMVWVNHKGEAYIFEGNNRVAVASLKKVKLISVEVQWRNGAEKVGGPLSESRVNEVLSEIPVKKYDPSQPRAPGGTPNGGQWVATGGVIPRSAMPQIRNDDLPAFYNFARNQGVDVTTEEVKASSLKFRQVVDPAHAKAMPAAILARPILVSQDNYVLDGNHRAAANAALGNKVTINRVGRPFKEAISVMFAFPGVLNLEQAEEARKYDPGQPRDEDGRWTDTGAMQIGPDNPPVPGKAFIAYRVGTEQGDSLAHRNAGDAMGVASYLGNVDDYDKPSFGNPATHLHVFEVTVDKAFGKYDRLSGGVNQTNNNSDGFVGMDVSPGGVVLSFGSKGYTATHRTSIPVERVRQYLRDKYTAADTASIGYSYDGNFDGHGTIRTQEAILALAERELSRKYDPNQPRHPAGVPEGGRFADASGVTGFHSSEGSVSDVLGYTRADLVNHPFTGETNKEAIALHDKIAVEHGDIADQKINHIELYQSAFYMQMNLALRFPDEYATFKGIIHSDVDATEAIDSGQFQGTNSHAYKVATAAFTSSGLAAATGKTLDHFGLTNLFDGGGLAETMARDMDAHAPTLPKGLKLYRAFRQSDIMNNPRAYIGQTFTEKGFASMTASAHFATKWGAIGTTRLILRTTTTGKERGVYLARNRGKGPEPYEYEVLLPAGAQFKINGITRTAGRDLVVDADIIEPGGTRKKAYKMETTKRERPTLPEKPRPERFGWTEEEMAHMFVAQKYDPNQPRAPAGTGIGGQWVLGSGFNSSAGSAVFEVAPNPNDKALKERWDKLSDKEKEDVSRKVLKSLVPQVAQELGITQYELVEHVGGWMGDVNPSFTMKALTGKQADAAARLLGHGLKQEGMMLLSNKAFPGSFEAGVVGIGLKGGGSKRATQIYGELSKLKKSDGGFLVQGFTMRGDYMEILHDGSYTGLSDKAFARKVAGSVDKAFDNKYDVHQTTAYASFIGEGDYLNAPQGRLAGGVEDWGRRADRVQSAAQKALEKELGRRGKDDGRARYTLRIKYDPNQPRNPAGSPGGGQWTSQGAFGFYAFIAPGAGKGALQQGEFYFARDPNAVSAEDVVEPDGFDPRQGDLFGATPSLTDLEITGTLGDEFKDTHARGLDVHHALIEEHAAYRFDTLDDDGVAALSAYQQSEYRFINSAAREGLDHEAISPMDSALESAPGIPAGITLYRGFRHHDLHGSAEDMIGKTFTEKGFMSTSASSHTVYQWLDSKDSSEGLIALRIHTTGKTKGLFMGSNDPSPGGRHTPYEYEALLPRNTTIKLIKAQRVPLGGEYSDGENDVVVFDAVIE